MTVTGTGMRVVVVDACPACAHPDSRVAYRPDAGAVERFIRLSRVKYQGVMDEWPRVLSLEVRECVHCGHLWYRTQPEERYLRQMYDASRPLYGAGGDPRIDRRMLREMKSLRRVLRYRGIAGPRLLITAEAQGTRAAPRSRPDFGSVSTSRAVPGPSGSGGHWPRGS